MRFREGRFGAAALGAAAVIGSASLFGSPGMAADAWPSEVNARYKVTFNGLDIGKFRFNSRIDTKGYTLDGRAELSALLGVFEWKGSTRASGALKNDAPNPAGYTFDFKSSSKRGSVKLGFTQGAVTNISLVPPVNPRKPTVPVTAQHLKGVLDPLSAVMALSRGSGGNPCARKLSIFDGKERFDLIFTPRGQERIAEARPSGQPDIGFVCRVKMVPISGHKLKDVDKDDWATSGKIEVTLRSVPSVNMFVPYQVRIPTMVGPAVLTSERIDIMTREHGQIALTN